jgi:hypothetical protein
MAVPIPVIHSPDGNSIIKKITESTKKNYYSPEAQFSGAEILKIEKHVKLLLDECKTQGVNDPFQVAYILATARYESRMGLVLTEPITEMQAVEKYFRLYGNESKKDAELYISRGYVGLKGKAAYSRLGLELSESLLANPELAAEPEIAAQVCVVGMKEGLISMRAKLRDYIQGEDHDYVSARNITNPTELQKSQEIASLIAKYADHYSKILNE